MSARPSLAIEGLAVRYGERRAVHALTLHVQPGELVGLIGPDGAGKTSSLLCLAGLLVPAAGRVEVCGEDPRAAGSTARERLGLMPQQHSLYGDLSIAENLWFFGRLFGLSRAVFEERRARLLSITQLERFADRRASALSGGMYKKLALACALLHRPDVLLMDEPTNGVDPVSRRELWELIYELVAEGMAVLVSTASMDEAARCQRVGLLHRGELILEGAPIELARALEYPVLEVEVADRQRLAQALDAHPDVVSVTPLGDNLRVLSVPGAAERLGARLGEWGARVMRTPAELEDVFLARLLEREEAA